MSKVFEKWKFLSLFLALFMVLGITSVKANEFAVYDEQWAPVAVSALQEDYVSKMVQDSDGNIYVAFKDNATNDIYVQKFNSSGVKQWTGNGVLALDVTDITGNPAFAEVYITLNGTNGVFVAAKTATGPNVYIQSVSSTGALQWGNDAVDKQDGITVTMGTATIANQFAMANIGTGLVLVAVDDGGGTGGEDRIVWTKRSLTTGAEVVGIKVVADPVGTAGNLKLKTHGSSSIILFSCDELVGGADTGDNIYANMVASNGTLLKAAGTLIPIKLGAAAGDVLNKVKITQDASDNVYVFYLYTPAGGNPTLFAKKLDVSNGTAGTEYTLLTANANNDLIAVAYNAANNTIGVLFDKAAAAQTLFNRVGISTYLGTWQNPADLTVDADDQYNDAYLIPLSSTSYMVVEGNVDNTTDDEIHADLITESDALGWTVADVTWSRSIVADVDDSGNITGYGLDSNSNITLLYAVTNQASLVQFAHKEKYDLAFSSFEAVSPSPFQLTWADGGTIQVKDKINNTNGDGDSPETTITYYLTNANTYEGSTKRLELGTRTVAAITTGQAESTTTTTSLTIPAKTDVIDANNFILAVVNQANRNLEINNANNEANVPIELIAADLRPTKIQQITPAGNVAPGETVTIEDTVKNFGNAAAGEFTISYYMCFSDKDNDKNMNEVNGNDDYNTGNIMAAHGPSGPNVLLGTRTVSSLGAGESDTAQTELTIPATHKIIGNAVRIHAFVDSEDAVVESDDDNNISNTENVGWFRLNLLQPNLEIDNVTISGNVSVSPGDTLQYSVTVENSGTDAAGAPYQYQGGGGDPTLLANTTATNVLVRAYVGPLGQTSISDIVARCTQVDEFTIDSIDAGATEVKISSFTIPDTGGASLYVYVDPDNSIQESDERAAVADPTNGNGDEVGLNYLALPDLTVSTLVAVPSQLDAGDTLNVSFTVSNISGTPAVASAAGVYLSTDTTLDASDPQIGLGAVPAIGGNGSETLSGDNAVSCLIPANTADGQYYLIVKADDGDLISELVETNNTATRQITVGEVETYPTLDLRIDPIAGTPGVAFHFTDNVYDANGAAHISANTIQTGTEAVDLYVKCTYPDGQSAWLYFDADGLVRFHDEPAPEWSNVTFDETTDYALIHSAWWFDNSKKAEWNLPIGTYTWEITVVKAGGSIDVPEDIVQTDSATLTLE